MNTQRVPCRFLLVCTAERPPGTKPACGGTGMQAFLLLQDALDKIDVGEPVVALPSGCLGFCEHAPVVVDPRGASPIAYVGVSAADLNEIARCATRVEGEPWRTQT